MDKSEDLKQYIKSKSLKDYALFSLGAFMIMSVVISCVVTYQFLAFDGYNLEFHVERLEQADPDFADPEDLEALEKITYEPVSIDQVPEICKQAVISIEDKTFYENIGVDARGVARLGLSALTFGSQGGGSTISQQVIKLSRDRFYDRGPIDKFIEILYAVRLNTQLEKDEILELYLNEAYFGDFNYGIQAASLNYYDKDVSELGLAECSYLAGVPQLPNVYAPTIGDIAQGRERQERVLEEMLEDGVISRSEKEEASLAQ